MHYHYFTLEQREALAREIYGMMESGENRGGLAAAMENLRSPAYGLCEACGADIPFSRLIEQPLLKRCRDCT